MKKFLLSLVCIFSLFSASGCFCSKPAQIYYVINAKNNENLDYRIVVEVQRIYRAPIDAACYKKVDDELQLIPNASTISDCYDSEGKYFEKATHALAEKADIEDPVTVSNEFVKSGENTYTSNKREIPDNSEHSIVYNVKIESLNTSFTKKEKEFYVKALSVDSILGGMIKEDAMDRVDVTLPTVDKTINSEKYYFVGKGENIVFSVKLRDLTTKDLEISKIGEIKLNFDLEFKLVD
jgi:hypothetical protein